MIQQAFSKCATVIVKHGTKFVVAGVGAAIAGTVSVISYYCGKKKGDKEGQKKASKIYEDKFIQIGKMFD